MRVVLRGLPVLILVNVHGSISELSASPVTCIRKTGTITDPSCPCFGLFILDTLLSSPITKLACGLLASTLQFCAWQGSRACLKRSAPAPGSATGLPGLPLGQSRRMLPGSASSPGKCQAAAGQAPAGGTPLSPRARQRGRWHLQRNAGS